MSREMRESGVYSIGEIPQHWDIIRFKFVAKLCNGKEITGDEGNIPVYGSGGVFKYTDKPLFSGVSLLMGRKGTIDKPMLVDGRFWTVDTMFYTSEITNILPKFLYYCAKGIIDYKFYKSGSVLPSMTQTEINNISLSFPPQSEQEIIVAYLDAKCSQIDALISNQQKQIEKLKQYKQSLITEAVTKGLNPDAEMKDSGVEWIGEIPSEWEMAKIKNVADQNDEKYTSGSYDYIALENVESLTSKFIQTESVYSLEGNKMADEGDVIFGKLRPYLRKVMKIKKNVCVSNEFIVYKPKSVTGDFLKYYLLSDGFISAVNASTYGTKMPRANSSFVDNCEIVFPKMNIQKEISNYLDEKCNKIDSLISIKQQKIEKLNEYKKSIIYEYVTGKKEA